MEDGCTVCNKGTISLDNVKVCIIIEWNLLSECFLRQTPIRWAIKQRSVSVTRPLTGALPHNQPNPPRGGSTPLNGQYGVAPLQKGYFFSGFLKDRDLTCWSILKGKQGCALAEPGGPWRLTFVVGWLGNLCFFIQIVCWAHWISQVQSTGLPSIFLKAQPWVVAIGKSVFLCVERPKRANRCFFCLWKKSRNWCSGFVIYSYFKESAFYNCLKGCNVLQWVCENGTFINRRYVKGITFLSEMGEGLDLRAEPLYIKLCWVPPLKCMPLIIQ